MSCAADPLDPLTLSITSRRASSITQGCGVVIGRTRTHAIALTAAHVVPIARPLVTIYGTSPAQVLDLDQQNDVATITFETHQTPPPPSCRAPQAHERATIYTRTPRGQLVRIPTEIKPSRLMQWTNGDTEHLARMFPLTAKVRRGQSGSGVWTRDNKLVGILLAHDLEEIGFMMSIEHALKRSANNATDFGSD